MAKARLIGQYCEYCSEELNTWDDRVRKALAFDFYIFAPFAVVRRFTSMKARSKRRRGSKR